MENQMYIEKKCGVRPNQDGCASTEKNNRRPFATVFVTFGFNAHRQKLVNIETDGHTDRHTQIPPYT